VVAKRKTKTLPVFFKVDWRINLLL